MPNTPIKNGSPKYCWGLKLTWQDADTLQVNAGAARNSSNVNDIVLDSAVDIDRNASGAGGLDTGTIAESSTYAVYIIGDSTGYQETAGMLSLDAEQPLLPYNYDMYRRIGWVLTDGSADLEHMYYSGDGTARDVWYKDGVSVIAGASSDSWARESIAAGVPAIGADLVVKFYASIHLIPNTAGNRMEFRLFGSAATSTEFAIAGDAAAIDTAHMATMPCLLNSSSVAEVEYQVSNAADVGGLWVLGFQDLLL